MFKAFSVLLALALSTVLIGCSGSGSESDAPASVEAPSDASAPVETTRVEGWWQQGDSAGPLVVELEGDEIVAVDRNLSHGDYGSTRDRFEFDSGRLVRYVQDSKLRMMDPDDPSRLVPVLMRLDFGEQRVREGGEKAIDRSFAVVQDSHRRGPSVLGGVRQGRGAEGVGCGNVGAPCLLEPVRPQHRGDGDDPMQTRPLSRRSGRTGPW